MKNTNEIEKQLARKADAYIEQKANEMFAIHEEIGRFLDGRPNFIDYITHFNSYDTAAPENKGNHTAYCDAHQTKSKRNVRYSQRSSFVLRYISSKLH